MSPSPFFDSSMVVLWSLVIVLAGATAWKKGRDGLAAGLHGSWRMFLQLMRIIPFAMLVAFMLAEVLPNEIVASWLGESSGVKGLAVAGVAGALVPSGPFLSFPVAITLLHSGAGVPQTVAFITGWAVLAVHRMFAMEIPLMGLRFTMVRLGASVFLPLIAGVTTYVLWPYFSGY